MPATDSSVSCALSAAIAVLAACSGPEPQAVRTTAAADSVKSTTPEAVAPPATPQLANNKPSPVVPDPLWFSPALYPKGTVLKKGRSPADDQGRFTSQLLFQLPDGATLADCTDPLARATEGIVANLGREDKDGRTTLRGEGPEYEVIFVCGEAKGKMTAFVSYRWIKSQPVESR